jgi:hypothetical protein
MLPEEVDFGRYTLEARRALAHSLRAARRSGARLITTDELLVGLGSPDVYASKYFLMAGIPIARPGVGSSEEGAGVSEDHRVVPFGDDARTVLRTAMHASIEGGRSKVSSADILVEVLGQSKPRSPDIEAIVSAIRAGMASDLREGSLPLE